MMLTVVKGPTTYDNIHKVGGTQYFSFRDACFAMGFLEDDNEFILAIKEESEWGSSEILRKLFFIMLLSGVVNRLCHVLNNTWTWISNEILHEHRILSCNSGLILNDEEIQNLALLKIGKILQGNRRTLKDFKPIPYPNGYVLEQLGNRLIYNEQNYDIVALKTKFATLHASLTDDQNLIFSKIIKVVTEQKGGVFFLHGHGGTGKTFMRRTLASYLRSRNQIVITVPSSGIATLLLPGGRTAHSKFKIPIPTLENSLCNVKPKDDLHYAI
ncbi:unnamed protein product [Lathyrus sativus]|nr:unnamed protein product [Lathyrus sativus]